MTPDAPRTAEIERIAAAIGEPCSCENGIKISEDLGGIQAVTRHWLCDGKGYTIPSDLTPERLYDAGLRVTPADSLDALRAALERMREFAAHDAGCLFAADLSGVNGDEYQYPNSRPCDCGFDGALALYDAALRTGQRSPRNDDTSGGRPAQSGQPRDNGERDAAGEVPAPAAPDPEEGSS